MQYFLDYLVLFVSREEYIHRFIRKVVKYVGDIIIRDETMNISYRFTPTREGYYAAAAKIDEITQKGHRVGGDIGRVRSYTG